MGEDPGGVDAESADVAREVGQSRWRRQVPQLLEQARAVGLGAHLALQLGADAGKGQVPRHALLVDCDD